MTKNFLQPVDPFPDPVHAGQEIEFIGIMVSELIIMLFLIVLIIYLHKKYKDYLPILITYLFSLLIGFVCLFNQLFPMYPYFHLFFIFFQTSIIILASFDYYEGVKKKKGI